MREWLVQEGPGGFRSGRAGLGGWGIAIPGPPATLGVGRTVMIMCVSMGWWYMGGAAPGEESTPVPAVWLSRPFGRLEVLRWTVCLHAVGSIILEALEDALRSVLWHHLSPPLGPSAAAQVVQHAVDAAGRVMGAAVEGAVRDSIVQVAEQAAEDL